MVMFVAGQATDVADVSGYSEVAKKDSLVAILGIAEQDIRGLYVAVQ